MNILVLSQYFWPEPFLINDLVLKIKQQGHEVTIFTGKPNYPDGDIYPGYDRFGIQEECYKNDIMIHRVPLIPRKGGGTKNLILNYASFAWSGVKYAFSFSKKRQFDAIFALGLSPVTSAIPAIVIKWITKAHLTIWVQDLWPESAQTTGYVRNPFLLNCMKYLVKGIYKCADTLMVQSEAFIKPVSTLANPQKIVYYANSAIDMCYQPNQMPALPNELTTLLDNHFCIVFAGNIGTAQAVETIVNAAMMLGDLTNLKIVLVGSGSMLDWVERKKQAHLLDNLVLAGRFPSNMMPALFNKAHALLVTLRDEPIYALTIPCKVQAYLSAGKPIIASLNGEGARVLKETGAALISPAEDAEALANSMRELYARDLNAREIMGANGRQYFLNHFEMDKQASRLMMLLETEISKTKRA